MTVFVGLSTSIPRCRSHLCGPVRAGSGADDRLVVAARRSEAEGALERVADVFRLHLAPVRVTDPGPEPKRVRQASVCCYGKLGGEVRYELSALAASDAPEPHQAVVELGGRRRCRVADDGRVERQLSVTEQIRQRAAPMRQSGGTGCDVDVRLPGGDRGGCASDADASRHSSVTLAVDAPHAVAGLVSHPYEPALVDGEARRLGADAHEADRPVRARVDLIDRVVEAVCHPYAPERGRDGGGAAPGRDRLNDAIRLRVDGRDAVPRPARHPDRGGHAAERDAARVAPTAIGSPTLSVCASIRTSVASPAFATHTAPAP